MEGKVAAAATLVTEIASIFADALEALEHGDTTLTYLQQSLGVKASPRQTQLRDTAERMRSFLKDHPLATPTEPNKVSAAEKH